jgi:DNA-binding response OmpR family regulator
MTTRIMVINNSDNILAMFRKILEIDDCEVFPQLFLNSDLRDVRRIKPDLIILDYYVGREGVGWEFLQLLKMDDSTSKVPVLLCTTAIKLVHEIGAYLATKQVTFLRKPFESRDLVNTVQSILGDSGSSSAITLPESNGSVQKKVKNSQKE